MMTYKNIIIILFLGFQMNSFAQKNNSVCKSCEKTKRLLSKNIKDIDLSAYTDDEHNIYVYCSDAKWFKNIMKPWFSGLRVEVASINNNLCNFNGINNSESPVSFTQLENNFRRKIIKRRGKLSNSFINIRLGKVPESLQNTSYTLNLIFTKRNKNCANYRFVPQYNQEYRANINYKQDSIQAIKQFIASLNIKLEPVKDSIIFAVPFKQNMVNMNKVYTVSNNHTYIIKPQFTIQPMQHKRILHNDIISVDIKTYSSIEGDSSLNRELALKRADTILHTLSSWGIDSSVFITSSAENWKLYVKQLQLPKYKSLRKYSANQIKERLKDTAVQTRLYDLLSDQREAYVNIRSESLHPIKAMQNNELLTMLNQYLLENKLDTVPMLQYELYDRVAKGNLSIDSLDLVVIPDTEDWINLTYQHVYFTHLVNPKEENISAGKMHKLLKGYAKDKELNYYTTYNKVMNLSVNAESVNRNKTLKEIKALIKLGVPQKQINKLQINYYLTLAEEFINNNNYKAKNKNLNSAYKLSRKIGVTESEELALAKYFDHMKRRDLSVKMLKPYIQQGKYTEEVLFTYLFLTIGNSTYKKGSNYPELINNAFNYNKNRFAKFYNPKDYYGIAIKLVQSPEYRWLYCIECADKLQQTNLSIKQ